MIGAPDLGSAQHLTDHGENNTRHILWRGGVATVLITEKSSRTMTFGLDQALQNTVRSIIDQPPQAQDQVLLQALTNHLFGLPFTGTEQVLGITRMGRLVEALLGPIDNGVGGQL